jgi:hypothetical protein
MAKEYFTRENLIDHLERLAYYGVSATIGPAIWWTVPICTAAGLAGVMFRCGCGTRSTPVRRCFARWVRGLHRRIPAQGHPSRADVPIPSRRSRKLAPQCRTTPKQASEFIKIWVDDRGGTRKKLTPELYLGHHRRSDKLNLPVAAHNDAGGRQAANEGGRGGLAAPSVRMGEFRTPELLAIIKDRIARRDRPNCGSIQMSAWPSPPGRIGTIRYCAKPCRPSDPAALG